MRHVAPIARRLAAGFMAVAALLGVVLGPGADHAEAQEPELTLGVFLPNAGFSSNAARSAWADRIASAIQQQLGGTRVRGRAFAKRSDVHAFLSAGKIDLLITDGLFLLERGGKVLGHGVDADGGIGPAAALYAAPGTRSVLDLRGKVVAVASSSSRDLAFFSNVALRGEVATSSFFGETRTSKDAAAALGAVKAGAAQAAFTVEGHPAATGLEKLASAGKMPMALLATRLGAGQDVGAEVAAAALAALRSGAGRGGGIVGWRKGGGGGLAAAGAAHSSPLVTSAKVELAPPRSRSVALPRIRLAPTGALPQPDVRRVTVAPALPAEDDHL